jgi:hypothetical protein
MGGRRFNLGKAVGRVSGQQSNLVPKLAMHKAVPKFSHMLSLLGI